MAMKALADFPPVNTRALLSQVLSEDYPRECRKLPIEGGWGYTRESAIKFVRSRFPIPSIADFVPIEYLVATKIIYEELIVFRPEGNRCSGIRVEREWQKLFDLESKVYDCISFRVSCWHGNDWDSLKREWEASGEGTQQGFNIEAHSTRRNELMKSYSREFWFDITEVFARRD